MRFVFYFLFFSLLARACVRLLITRVVITAVLALPTHLDRWLIKHTGRNERVDDKSSTANATGVILQYNMNICTSQGRNSIFKGPRKSVTKRILEIIIIYCKEKVFLGSQTYKNKQK